MLEPYEGNSHVRFLGEKGAAMPLTYPMNGVEDMDSICNGLVMEKHHSRQLMGMRLI